MPFIKLTDFPMVYEVRDEYKRCRQNGASRAEAVEMLKNRYSAELNEGTDDDALLFWIGLAEGQCHYEELTAEMSEQALSALSVVEHNDWELSPVDIRKRREQYSCAPMPEKIKIRKSSKFRCNWKIGDTYAYKLRGDEVEKCGLAGKSLLIRKVDEREPGDGRVLPIVMLSICPSDSLPTSTEEYNQYPLLMLENRRSIEPFYFEFRADLVISSRRMLNNQELKFVGNFSNAHMPKDEVIIQALGMAYMIPVQLLDMFASVFWRKQPMFLDILKSIQS